MKTTQRNLIMVLPVPKEIIERRIYFIRGLKVVLDRDIAELYQVKAIALRQQVKRNVSRFPGDFVFQLSKNEINFLVSQNVIPSIQSLGGFRPYAFTEQGVAMLSSVLRSPRAIAVNIAIMRAFVSLREIMSTHKDLARKIESLELKQQKQGLDISIIFKVIKKLLKEPEKPKKQIGFRI